MGPHVTLSPFLPPPSLSLISRFLCPFVRTSPFQAVGRLGGVQALGEDGTPSTRLGVEAGWAGTDDGTGGHRGRRAIELGRVDRLRQPLKGEENRATTWG